MSPRAAFTVAAAALALVLAGCVTSGDGREVDPQGAARANLQLGVAYLQQGNLPLAKEKLERAARQDPRNADVQSALGVLYERLDRKGDAERHHAAARRMAPGSGEITNTYAVFLCRNGKTEQALREFETAAKNPLYGTPWAALSNAAVCLRSARRDAEAVKYLEQAINLRPDFSAAYTELAEIQLLSGDAEAAARTVERYLALGVASPDVLLMGVRAARVRNDTAALTLLTRRLRRDFPNSPQTQALTQLLGDQGAGP